MPKPRRKKSKSRAVRTQRLSSGKSSLPAAGSGRSRATKHDRAVVETKREVYLESLRSCPSFLMARVAAGVSHVRADMWRRETDFEEQVQAAHSAGCAVLEREAKRRGADGFVSRQFYDSDGNVMSETRSYSDALLGKLLTANHPAYKAKLEVEGSININVQLEVDLSRLTEDELTALEALVQKARNPDGRRPIGQTVIH